MTACQEELTAPGVVSRALPRRERRGVRHRPHPAARAPTSSYTGYVLRRRAGSTAGARNGLPAGDARAVYRFQPRRGLRRGAATALRAYTVGLRAALAQPRPRATRCSTASSSTSTGSTPRTIDSSATFASITSQLVPEATSSTASTCPTPSTRVWSGRCFGEPTSPRWRFLLEGDGVLAIGVGISAPKPSGIRLGAAARAERPDLHHAT